MVYSGSSSRVQVPGLVAGTWAGARSSLQVPGTAAAGPRSVAPLAAVPRHRWIGSVGLGDPDMGRS